MSSSSLQPILALLGHPVAGNPTQYMLEKAFAHHEMDWRYLTLDVAPEALGDALRGMRAMGFTGGNCAEPHKQAVIPHLDRTTEAAGLIGGVNVIFREGDELVGENTEGKALVESLRGRINPADARIVLLGAGRMARCVAVELATAKVGEIVVVDRTESRARELADLVAGKLQVAASPVGWDDSYRVPPETNVVINATSVSEQDAEAHLPIVLDTLAPPMIVADVTLDPPQTWLLDEAAQRGCATLDGLEVFVRQAAVNFKLWTDVDPELTILREAVEEFLEL